MSRYRIIMSALDARKNGALDVRTDDSAVEVARALAIKKGWFDPAVHERFEDEVSVCYLLDDDVLENMGSVTLASLEQPNGTNE